MASPQFKINGSATSASVSVTSGGTVTALLDSIAGVKSCAWTILRTDDTGTPGDAGTYGAPSLSGVVDQQAQWTAQTAGTAATIQCTINGGIDPDTGYPSTAMTTTGKFYVPTTTGLEVLVAGEYVDTNVESNSTHGMCAPINEAIRAGGGGLGDWKESCRLVTVAALPAYTRTASQIVANANGAMPNVDGTAPALTNRILLDGTGTASDVDNGIWVVSDLGSGATPWVLDRAADCNESAEVTDGMRVPIAAGATKADHLYVLTSTDPLTVNTSNLVFTDWGTVTLVTTTQPGTVAALGANNTVLTQPAGAAGGVWATIVNANVAAAAAIAGTKVAPDFGAQDIATTGNCTLTGGSLAVNSSGGWARLGLVAGSGAGSAAAAGGLRMQGNGAVQGRVVFRNAADGADVGGMSCIAGDVLFVGGPYPVRPNYVDIDGVSGARVYVNGGVRLTVATAAIEVATATSIQFASTVVAPVFQHAADASAGVTGDDTTLNAQGVSDPAGNAVAGDLLVRGGRGTVHAGNTDGNVALHEVPANWQAMEEGLFVSDAVTAPTGNPAAGGFLYSNAGAGTWRGSGGTVTVFGPAEPHCPRCGRDAAVSWTNEDEGWALEVCMWCASDVLTDAIIRKEQV